MLDNTIAGSAAAFSRSAHTLFKSSVHSSNAPSSSLFAGSKHTNSRICCISSASSATTSTIPTSSIWNLADAVSHFETSLPAMAFGEFTNNFALAASMKVKSVNVGIIARPPPQLPKIAVICGITPEAFVCFI